MANGQKKKAVWRAWRAGDPWEVNLARIIKARAAASRGWSAARRREHSRRILKRRKDRSEAASDERAQALAVELAGRPRFAAARARAKRGVAPVHAQIPARLVLAMEPGEYYGLRDIARMTGIKLDSIKPVVYRGSRELFERAVNADWLRLRERGEVSAGVANQTPRHLQRLSPAGVAWREELLLGASRRAVSVSRLSSL